MMEGSMKTIPCGSGEITPEMGSWMDLQHKTRVRYDVKTRKLVRELTLLGIRAQQREEADRVAARADRIRAPLEIAA